MGIRITSAVPVFHDAVTAAVVSVLERRRGEFHIVHCSAVGRGCETVKRKPHMQCVR